MLDLASPHLVYSLNGLPLTLLDLTPILTEQLYDLNIRTLEHLASIALISSVAERRAIIDLIEQNLRARLWPDFVHCCALIASEDGEQSQFVIESEQFHFVALVTSHEDPMFTCNYKWLQTGIGESVPFHKPHQVSDSRLPPSIKESAALPYQIAQATHPVAMTDQPPIAMSIDAVGLALAPKTVMLDESLEMAAVSPAHPGISPEMASLPLNHLNLSNRTHAALMRGGIRSIGQLAALSDNELSRIINIGVASLREIRHALLRLPDEILMESTSSEKVELLITEFPVLHVILTEIQDFPVRFLNLSTRTVHALHRSNIYVLGKLLLLSNSELFNIPNMGVKSIEEIHVVLRMIDIAELRQIMAGLREQGKKPKSHPLSYLGLITLERRLHALDIGDAEDLCRYTAIELQEKGFQSFEVSSIVAMLRAYGLTLCSTDPNQDAVSQQLSYAHPDRDADASELQAQPTPPEAAATSENIVEPKPITLTDAIRAMLTQVEPRQAEVLRRRYGLEGREVYTLAEIGQQLNLTRERVRQLEQKAINKLQHPHRHRVLDGLTLSLKQALRDSNGVISLEAARETLSAHADSETTVSESLLAFVLLFAPHITTVKKIPILILNSQPYATYISAIDGICTALKRAVTQAFAPLSLAEVLARFAADTDGQTLRLHAPEAFIIACLNAHPDIVLDDEGLYGLKQWSNKRLDDIIIVMRQHGKPLHYSEIAERMNQRLPIDQQTTAHNVHAQIGRLPDLFVRVGHGIFGLAERGLKQDRTLADAAYRVLCEANHALDIEQLTDRVLETWHVKRTSIRAAIDLDDRFTQVGRNMYWLADAPLSDPEGGPANDFETLFGEVLLRRHEELERDRAASSEHDALEEFRRLGTVIFS